MLGSGRGNKIVCRNCFLSQYRNKSEMNTFLCFRKNWVSKNFKHENRISQFSVENFLSHSTGKLRREVLRCFGKNRISKSFKLKRGIWLICVGTSLCHSTGKLHRGTLLCFRRFLLSKKIMDKRVSLGREGGREYNVCPSKTFYLMVPKNFVCEPYRISLVPGIEKY